MSDAANRFSKIDVETVRGLLIANGGGAVAMLALVPSVLDRPGYESVAWAMLLGMLIMVIGVALAIAHNHFRRECMAQEAPAQQPGRLQNQPNQQQSHQSSFQSNQQQGQQQNQPGGQSSFSRPAAPAPAARAKRPIACLLSLICMWSSVASFIGAGAFVSFTGVAALSAAQAAKAPPRTAPVADPKAKAKR
jgi:hypothetical protein